MKTSKICPRCGKNNTESKRYCVECGARLGTENTVSTGNNRTTPTTQELREAWQAIRARRDLHSSGAWDILMGILIIAAGFAYIERSSCNSALLVIGLLLIGAGIAVRRAPGSATSLAHAIAMLLAALWSTTLFVAAIVGTSSRVQIVGGPAFFLPIVFAIMYFRTHARFVRTQHVAQDLVADLDQEIKDIQKTKLSANNDLIAFRARGRRWKGKLGTARVTLVTRNGRKAHFALPDEFVVTAQEGIASGKQGQVTIETGTETWKAKAPYESLQHYERWQATQTGDRQPTRDTASYQQVISLLQEITGHMSSAPEDASQEERIARLVRMGSEAVPAAIGAVWSAIRYQDGDRSGFENAGLLCEAIGRMGGSKAFDALARFATQESNAAGYRHVKLGAVRGLAHFSDRRAIELLHAALDDADEDVRRAASEALEESSGEGKEETAQVTAQEEQQRVDAPIKEDLTPEIRALIQKLSLKPRGLEIFHPDKSAAIQRIEELGTKAFEPLLEALEQADVDAKGTILYLLGRLRDRRALVPLSRQLKHPSPSVRVEALDALQCYDTQELENTQVIEYLREASRDAQIDVRDRAREILERLDISVPQMSWAHGANTWEEIAEAFTRIEVPKDSPDFAGLVRLLEEFDGPRRHGAWHRIAFAFKQKGDRGTATQCFVEALSNNPDAASSAWSQIEMSPDLPGAASLRQQLSTYPSFAAGNRAESARLAKTLRQLVGTPGQTRLEV